MSSPFTLFFLISGLIDQANNGVHEAIDASADQYSAFIATQIELELKCFITHNNSIEVIPSNGEVSNYYGISGDSTFRLQLKLKP